jgi:Fe-S-cluster containining protein
MSLEKTAPDTIQEMLQPLGNGQFQFACHPGVPCFTECCRDLKLLLTPYDILRLKNHLGLDARTFLDQHTNTELDVRRNLPMIYLRMQDNPRKTCPFVSATGCQVYPDRPAACRIYPVARASRMHRLHGTVQEDYFVLHEAHCRGFEESRTWSVQEWTQDQGLEKYHHFNNQWMEIITHPKLLQENGISEKQQQMFFLASYNMDKFRDFVLAGRFLDLFDLPEGMAKAVVDSDEALLELAFLWLKFSLCNEPVLKIRGR